MSARNNPAEFDHDAWPDMCVHGYQWKGMLSADGVFAL
jgi:hypothetical protein